MGNRPASTAAAPGSARAALLVVLDDRLERDVEAAAALQAGQLHDAGATSHLAADLAQQLDRSVERAASRQQVVEDHPAGDAAPRPFLDLDVVGAVVHVAGVGPGRAGQLALPAAPYSAQAEFPHAR